MNHKDFNRKNNNVENLEIITHRENSNRKHIKSTSQYVGASWFKRTNKWRANIQINGKQKSLGYFTTELEAHEAYQNALEKLTSIY